MPTPTPEYRRLPGRGLRRTGAIALSRTVSRLWLGTDHLLCIESTGYSEDYRRFYFADIQSFTLRTTSRGRNGNILLGTLAAVWAVAGLPFGPIWAAIFWTLSGLFLVVLLINAMRGPTCICHLQTAVQRDQLPSLNRLRVAHKVLAQVRPILEQVQGTLTAEEVVARLRSAALTGPGQAGAASLKMTPTLSPSGGPNSPYSGRIHAATFCLLLGLGALGCVDFFLRHVALVLLATALSLGTAVAAIIAVVRQHNSGLSRALQRLSWVILGFIAINGLIGYIVFFVYIFRQAGQVAAGDHWQHIHLLAEMSPFDSPFHLTMSIFLISGSWILGGLGLAWLRQFRRMQARLQEAMPASTSADPPLS